MENNGEGKKKIVKLEFSPPALKKSKGESESWWAWCFDFILIRQTNSGRKSVWIFIKLTALIDFREKLW